MKTLTKNKKLIIATVIVIMVCVAIYGAYSFFNRPDQIKITYSDFIDKVESGEVSEVYLYDGPQLQGLLINGERFTTDNPRIDNLKEMLLINSVEVVEVNEQYTIGQVVTFIILIGVFIGLAIFLSRNNGRQASKEYDKMSSIEFSTEKEQQLTFSSVAGNDEAKDSLMELVDFLKNPDKYQRYGARMPKGVILYGPPGTGKTLMAKALASEAKVDFMAVSGSDFVQIYAGLGAARIRSLFKSAREKRKCVIFIDEIDAIGKKRDRGGLGGSDESDRTLNALLTEMSGFKGSEGIIILAATNRVDTLDDALLRPGRFDRQIEVGLPDFKARKEILKLYTENRPIAPTIDLSQLAQQTVYFSGAKLESLMNEAAIYAARENAESISDTHIDKAFYTVIAGEEKKDRSQIAHQDRKITAFHEAGHTVATKLLAPQNKVTKVTIIPSTKGAGGFSMNIPPDKMFHTKMDMLNNIKISLAGRVVEEIIFGKDNITTGASNDIQKATETLMMMIKHFGMSEKMGMLNYEMLLGQQTADGNLVKECNQSMETLYNETKQLINDNIDLVNDIANQLLLKETLKEDQIDIIVQECIAKRTH
ncbi:ATP-dependent metallopeptidase FtsH/Yme1/Tma family protein [Alkaliphilus peptidifermentans]|uniref:ATP-dependent zinc metalloprotease FtsH n=1 Tax=Alkaliphilus peptidifermentans DSM 18978 TaxID=1120976 RepID=A0A1G5CMB0_9FIRM|nr:ATP-dependent metallopeptidase FtsH/Yme1/Tma family protein [Alkaliphilus peptidifermentans]SCY03593.1 cell division protease FtsH [Alkaliphilus peptidifermentans DSM 18978]